MLRQEDIEAEVKRELARSRRMGLWLLAFRGDFDRFRDGLSPGEGVSVVAGAAACGLAACA